MATRKVTITLEETALAHAWADTVLGTGATTGSVPAA